MQSMNSNNGGAQGSGTGTSSDSQQDGNRSNGALNPGTRQQGTVGKRKREEDKE